MLGSINFLLTRLDPDSRTRRHIKGQPLSTALGFDKHGNMGSISQANHRDEFVALFVAVPVFNISGRCRSPSQNPCSGLWHCTYGSSARASHRYSSGDKELHGQLEIYLPPGGGPRRCKAIRVQFRTTVKLDMGRGRMGGEKKREDEVIFERKVELRGVTAIGLCLDEGIQM